MALPTQAILAYTASAVGGLTPAQLQSLMSAVVLYQAPPLDAPPGMPFGTSDAVLDVLMGANVMSDDHGIISGIMVTRTVTLGLRPAAGSPTAPSFVSLGNAGPATAPTNNPPFPPALPYLSPPPNPSAWIGSVVSSSGQDTPGSFAIPGQGAQELTIAYNDTTGASHTEVVVLNGTTPVNLVNPNKYVITQVTISAVGPSGYGPWGQVNIWSGQVDPVTGYPTGKLVGYLPNSYFRNFAFAQLAGWTPAQVANPIQAYQLVPPDYNYPDQTVNTPVGTPPPPPSKYLLDYPPPSSVTNENPGETPSALLVPQPNFGTPNPYLSEFFYGGAPTVPNPFQGAGLGAFAKALNMPVSRVPQPGTVSMTVAFA
jgi:hypothetical protein